MNSLRLQPFLGSNPSSLGGGFTGEDNDDDDYHEDADGDDDDHDYDDGDDDHKKSKMHLQPFLESNPSSLGGDFTGEDDDDYDDDEDDEDDDDDDDDVDDDDGDDDHKKSNLHLEQPFPFYWGFTGHHLIFWQHFWR